MCLVLRDEAEYQQHDGDQREGALRDRGPGLVRRRKQQHDRGRRHRSDAGENKGGADGVITRDVAKAALAVYDVDELGLDRLDRAVLSALTRSFGGGPVGVSTLAVAVGEEPTTVEEVCEPFLVRAGMIARTPRGRVATAQAWTHLGLTPPAGVIGLGQPGLFE